MDEALEIADLSGRELGNLRAHKKAIQSKNTDINRLADEFSDLSGQRKTAYARFREIAGFKDRALD
jgi:hypothetical protein